jgi:hypothetical protein
LVESSPYLTSECFQEPFFVLFISNLNVALYHRGRSIPLLEVAKTLTGDFLDHKIRNV